MIPSGASMLVAHEGPGKPGPSALWATGNWSLDTLLAQAGPDSASVQTVGCLCLQPEVFRAGTSLSHRSTRTVPGRNTLLCSLHLTRSGPEHYSAAKRSPFRAGTLATYSMREPVPGRNTLNECSRQRIALSQQIDAARVILRVPGRNSSSWSISHFARSRHLCETRSGPERHSSQHSTLGGFALPVPGRNTPGLSLASAEALRSREEVRRFALHIDCSGPEQSNRVPPFDHPNDRPLFVQPVPGRNTHPKETLP